MIQGYLFHTPLTGPEVAPYLAAERAGRHDALPWPNAAGQAG